MTAELNDSDYLENSDLNGDSGEYSSASYVHSSDRSTASDIDPSAADETPSLPLSNCERFSETSIATDSQFVDPEPERSLPRAQARVRPVYESTGVISEDERPAKTRKVSSSSFVSTSETSSSPEFQRTRSGRPTSSPFWRHNDGRTEEAQKASLGADTNSTSKTSQGNGLKMRSRVGSMYQVETIPRCGTWVENHEIDVGGDVLWDPTAANQSRLANPAIDQLFKKDEELFVTAKTRLMHLLHEKKYDPVAAMVDFDSFRQSRGSNTDSNCHLTAMQKFQLREIFANQHIKDFHAISRATGHNLETILTCYYSWKRTNAASYKIVKRIRRRLRSKHLCILCDAGGTLIYCQQCRRPFHVGCLTSIDPPLADINDNSCLCETCKKRNHVPIKNEAVKSSVCVGVAPETALLNVNDVDCKKDHEDTPTDGAGDSDKMPSTEQISEEEGRIPKEASSTAVTPGNSHVSSASTGNSMGQLTPPQVERSVEDNEIKNETVLFPPSRSKSQDDDVKLTYGPRNQNELFKSSSDVIFVV